ncbi:hypothetical protein B0A52_08965 [Exophiala mesophila]|uniref:Uncharacterized protein n=1 Tax=Exophiala mesophila TaxID=212818 RepID=A0A438MSW1_EXOME|nr:hypothetical protein B0A52_08965 [Exophiala mesophila]
MDESLKIDGSLVQLLLRHLAVTHLHKTEFFNGIQGCLRLATDQNLSLARSNADTLALAIILLYQQAQYPQFDFFSPNGILKLREVTPSSLGQVMEDVRANYEGDQPLAIWNTMTEKSMLRAGRHRTKVHVIEFIPRQPVGPVKNLRRIRSLP